jgi:hypothetical protein
MSAIQILLLHIHDPYSCHAFSFTQDSLTQYEVFLSFQFQVPTKDLCRQGPSQEVSIILSHPAFHLLAHHTSPFDVPPPHLSLPSRHLNLFLALASVALGKELSNEALLPFSVPAYHPPVEHSLTAARPCMISFSPQFSMTQINLYLIKNLDTWL